MAGGKEEKEEYGEDGKKEIEGGSFANIGGRVGVAISQLHGQEKRVGVHNAGMA